MTYWAVMPATSGSPEWSLDNCRIEKASTAREACDLAFGRSAVKSKYNLGIWLAKDLGTKVRLIQSNRQRHAMLTDRNGWMDPYENKQRR